MQNQNERMISDYYPVNGIGVALLKDGTTRDIFVHGYFQMGRWYFIVHQDVVESDCITVSEASSGASLKDEIYETVEDALWFATPFVQNKKFYFATKVSDILVRTQKNLLKANIGLRTLAIDVALWM